VYGIPENFDPGIFVGTRLDVISFGAYVVGLSFERSTPVVVSLEGGYRHDVPGEPG